MKNKQAQFQFKTNINCSGCVATVRPHLDKAAGIVHWEVDTSGKDKILTVTTEGISPAEIMETVRQTGFNITPVPA